MNAESRYFKLGLFVITGIALIVAGVVVFGAGEMFRHYVDFETATEGSVEGLTVGAAVKYAGVQIGKVSRIDMAMWRYHTSDPAKALETRRYVVIEFQIEREKLPSRNAEEMAHNFKATIEQGLRVRPASSGLTGPAYLELVFLDPDANPPPTLPFTLEEAYVPAAPSQMAQIVETIDAVLAQVKKANLEQIGKRAVALVDEVRGTNARIHQILDKPEVDRTMADLPVIAENVKRTSARLNEILHDPKLTATLNNIETATAAAAPAAADLRRTLRRVDALVTSQSQDLESIIVSLRRILDNGALIVEDAKQNPSRILFGEPPPHIQPGGQP